MAEACKRSQRPATHWGLQRLQGKRGGEQPPGSADGSGFTVASLSPFEARKAVVAF